MHAGRRGVSEAIEVGAANEWSGSDEGSEESGTRVEWSGSERAG